MSMVECLMGGGRVLGRETVGPWSYRALMIVDQTLWYRLRMMVARIS